MNVVAVSTSFSNLAVKDPRTCMYEIGGANNGARSCKSGIKLRRGVNHNDGASQATAEAITVTGM
jgi:hypothetical protein